MTKLSGNDMRVSRGAGLIEAEVDDELMGLHIENGTCYNFNRTATLVWKLIEQPRQLSEICASLSDQYKVDPATCESDVRALLADLSSDGIVKLG